MGNEKIIIPGVLTTIAFLLILNYAGFFDQVSKSVVDFKEIVEDTAPVITDSLIDSAPGFVDAGKVLCDPTGLISEAIEPYMLNNVNNETKDILLKLKDGQKITACEIKTLDENLIPLYKSKINFKIINPKILGCNLLDCVEKYDLVPTP